MKCDRREGESNESIAVKEAMSTKTSWKVAPKAFIKEENVKAAIAKCEKRKN